MRAGTTVPSTYGRDHGLVCDHCGQTYDRFRIGLTFADARRVIISIGVDRKTGKTKYGRRHGVLGYLFELKQLEWKHHVAQCEDAQRDVRRKAAGI